MAQDPLTLLMNVDTVNNSIFNEKLSHVMGNPKRYATYFPSRASIEKLQQDESDDDDDDDSSTWEFNAPISDSSRSSSSTSCTSVNTPAQEIIIRYRSGMTVDTRSTSPSQYSEPDSWGLASPTRLSSHFEYLPVTPDQDIKARYRQSRYDALLDTYQEALGIARAAGLKRNAKVICNRPGCWDRLPNVVALMYHLHIHDIHDRQVVCPRCQSSFDGHRELTMHKCKWRSQPSRTSPLRETFRRVFTRFSL